GSRRRLHRGDAEGAGGGGLRPLARGRHGDGGAAGVGDPGDLGPAPHGGGGSSDAQRAGAGGGRRGGVRAGGGAHAGAAVERVAAARRRCGDARGDGGEGADARQAGRGARDRGTDAVPGGVMEKRDPGTNGRARDAAGLDLRALARTGPVPFVGSSGAGASALAELVLRSGGRVTGCDLRSGPVVDALRALGADVAEGHDPSHVADAVAVVTTAAVPADHPELAEARSRGIPVLKRAEALGALVNRGTVVAVAGTHGKTTTTAMTTAILAEAGLDPTGFVGGRVPEWGSGLRAGSD